DGDADQLLGVAQEDLQGKSPCGEIGWGTLPAPTSIPKSVRGRDGLLESRNQLSANLLCPAVESGLRRLAKGRQFFRRGLIDVHALAAEVLDTLSRSLARDLLLEVHLFDHSIPVLRLCFLVQGLPQMAADREEDRMVGLVPGGQIVLH